MKKIRTILSIIIMLMMLLSYCPYSFAMVTDSDNGKMYYYKNNRGCVDVKGYVNGELQRTTFFDGGYEAVLKVDENDPEEMRLEDYLIKEGINGVKYDINCSFINNGRYVKIAYTLTNMEDTNKTISLGVRADVQIAENDYATIERFENSNGLKLYNEEENIQFNFYGKSVVGTTDIDNLWIGEYPDHDDNCFSNNTINKLEKKDSAFTFSWIDRTLLAGATNTYSVIIGMGEVSNAPKIELDENQGKFFSQDSVTINGTISDADENSKATLYYTVDGGVENSLKEEALIDNKLEFVLDLTSQDLSIGDHTLNLWAIDDMGNPSEIVEKKIYITNLKAPVLNMSEEWSKETVKFTIEDTVNEATDVLKYQYKIADGEWKDVELNTETEALSQTGSAVVKVRTVGNETDEYSSIVSKTARVDKDTPVITITENDGKVTINATDEHSGVDSTKYIFSNSEELSEEEFVDYTEVVEYKGTEEKTVYLHIISKDKVGNEKIYMKKYNYPVAAKIETKEEFVVEKPTYTLKVEETEMQEGYIYQVKVNDGEWQNVALDTLYTISEPIVGKNVVKTRTIDVLGRISSEVEVEINYVTQDSTTAPGSMPNAGKSTMLFGILITLVISLVIIKNKSNKLKDII